DLRNRRLRPHVAGAQEPQPGQQPYRGICAMRLFPPPIQKIVDRLGLHNVDQTDVHLRSPGVFCICDVAPLAASMKLAKEPVMSKRIYSRSFYRSLMFL